MKSTLMAVLVGLVLLSCSVALGGGQEAQVYRDKHHRIVTGTPDSASYNPTWSGSVWNWAGYTDGLPPTNTVISSNQYLLLALENVYVATFAKEVTVTINYTGGGPLLLQKASSGNNGFPTSVGSTLSETNSSGVYTLVYKIVPQPAWEWVLIKSTGTSTLTSVTINSRCIAVLKAWAGPKTTANKQRYHAEGRLYGDVGNNTITLRLYDRTGTATVGTGTTITVTVADVLTAVDWSTDWVDLDSAKYVKATLTSGLQSQPALVDWGLGEKVPSLSGWGLVVLVTCLAGTALWVFRKRRTALAR